MNYYLWTLSIEHWTLWYELFYLWSLRFEHLTLWYELRITRISRIMFAIMIRVIRVIRSLVDSVFVLKYVIEVYVSVSFCLLSHSVCQSFSLLVNYKGTNCVRINGFLVCKRCPLRRLLTPFWSLIKHLLKPLLQLPDSKRLTRVEEITCFRFILSRSLICFVKIIVRVDRLTSRQVNKLLVRKTW